MLCIYGKLETSRVVFRDSCGCMTQYLSINQPAFFSLNPGLSACLYLFLFLSLFFSLVSIPQPRRDAAIAHYPVTQQFSLLTVIEKHPSGWKGDAWLWPCHNDTGHNKQTVKRQERDDMQDGTPLHFTSILAGFPPSGAHCPPSSFCPVESFSHLSWAPNDSNLSDSILYQT